MHLQRKSTTKVTGIFNHFVTKLETTAASDSGNDINDIMQMSTVSNFVTTAVKKFTAADETHCDYKQQRPCPIHAQKHSTGDNYKSIQHRSASLNLRTTEKHDPTISILDP